MREKPGPAFDVVEQKLMWLLGGGLASESGGRVESRLGEAVAGSLATTGPNGQALALESVVGAGQLGKVVVARFSQVPGNSGGLHLVFALEFSVSVK